MNQLDDARKIINEIDENMASLFEQRMKAVESVIDYKIKNNMEIFDSKREQEVILRNAKMIQDESLKEYYIEFLQSMMDISKKYQHMLNQTIRVGYQGVKGAFSYIAASSIFKDTKLKEMDTFEEVFQKVISGELNYGVIPFENSYTGEVGEVLDLLLKYDVYINEIYDLKIDQNLLGTIDSKIEDIKQVYSKDQAIYQSKAFLHGRGFELIPYPNTALAAKYISEENDPSKAAIASKETAKLYGLKILAENINTSMDNTTRFIVITLEKPKSANHFNMLFTLNHDVGSLASIMQLIANKGFNMESIKSRSLQDRSWEYYFYVEVVGDCESLEGKELLKSMEETCMRFKLLGSYQKGGNKV